jgi:putative redox protein
MEVTAEYTHGVQFEIAARGHKLVCDQPIGNGGEDSGMTPPEFLLASLASCAGFYAVQYLRTRNLPPDGVRIRVTAEKAAQPARLAQFGIDVEVPEIEERHRAGVLRAVKSCLVHNTLLHAPSVNIDVHTVTMAA